jgi:hypothetical protein
MCQIFSTKSRPSLLKTINVTKTLLAMARLTACFTGAIEDARFVSRVWKCTRYLVAEEGRLCMDIAEAPGPEAGQSGA